MSNEIYNLYLDAGIIPKEFPKYPVLSEHQQLALIKELCRGRWVEIAKRAFREGAWYAGGVDYKRRIFADSFEEAVCGLIRKYWNEMNKEDKTMIRNILKDE